MGAWGTLIHEKKLRSKISCQTPFKEAKTILEEAVKAKADADLDNNNILDDRTNSCISKMLLVLTALVAHSEGLTSSIIDIFQAGQAHPPPKNSQANQPSARSAR